MKLLILLIPLTQGILITNYNFRNIKVTKNDTIFIRCTGTFKNTSINYITDKTENYICNSYVSIKLNNAIYNEQYLIINTKPITKIKLFTNSLIKIPSDNIIKPEYDKATLFSYKKINEQIDTVLNSPNKEIIFCKHFFLNTETYSLLIYANFPKEVNFWSSYKFRASLRSQELIIIFNPKTNKYYILIKENVKSKSTIFKRKDEFLNVIFIKNLQKSSININIHNDIWIFCNKPTNFGISYICFNDFPIIVSKHSCTTGLNKIKTKLFYGMKFLYITFNNSCIRKQVKLNNFLSSQTPPSIWNNNNAKYLLCENETLYSIDQEITKITCNENYLLEIPKSGYLVSKNKVIRLLNQ